MTKNRQKGPCAKMVAVGAEAATNSDRRGAMLTHSRYVTWSEITCYKCEKPIHGHIKWLQSNPPKPVHVERKECLKEKRERK